MQGRCNVKRGFPSFWGDGSDGVLSAGDTYIEGTDFEQYSDFCIRQFSEINWAPGSAETLTVDEPCRGLILFVDGDVNIGANATISMKKLGSILPANPSELIDLYGDSIQMRHIVDTLKTLRGGAGGNGGNGYANAGSGGIGGLGRVCQGGIGGGGGGGVSSHHYTGTAGSSVEYPELLPGPGGHWHNARSGFNGGGAGGHGDMLADWTGSGGGRAYGAGGGGGSGHLGTIPGDGEHTGGFIVIIAKGSVTIAGTLDVTGGNGGVSGYCNTTYDGGGGGGAGGGVVAVFALETIDTSSAIKNLSGGTSPGKNTGTAGGNGTYYEERLFV